MPGTVDLPGDVLARLQAEAARRGVSIDSVIAELAAALPAERPPAKRTFSFIGRGSTSSGRPARDADEIVAEGFGRT